MKVIHVLRKPVSEGSIAQNVLKHGTGALNIDECRISAPEALVRPPLPRTDNTVLGKGLGRGTQTEPGGRWPANLILQHLDGCQRDGTKRVTGTTKPCVRGVANWICVEGCPVKALDEQTGELGDNHRESKANGVSSIWGSGRSAPTSSISDMGGASRFFKQVRADEGD